MLKSDLVGIRSKLFSVAVDVNWECGGEKNDLQGTGQHPVG